MYFLMKFNDFGIILCYFNILEVNGGNLSWKGLLKEKKIVQLLFL